MDNTISKDFWELLNLTEDFYKTGFKKKHTETYKLKIHNKNANNTERKILLNNIHKDIAECKKCSLYMSRKNTVPGKGCLDPFVMLIGECPGEEEDVSGFPFVGKSGEYLDKWLAAIKISPYERELKRNEDIFITNMIKCHPSGNREPEEDESDACLNFLKKQIKIIKPKIILTISHLAIQTLLKTSLGMNELRGKVHNYLGTPLIATYHPKAVLLNSSLRGPVWEDLKLLKSVLNDDKIR